MRTTTFALFCGITFLSLGVLGLIPAAHMPVPVLHNAVYLGAGVWGVLAGRGVGNPKVFARVLAVGFALLAALGLVPGANTLFGVLPLHGYDVWLHAVTAALAAYFGWRAQTDEERRRAAVADRREEVHPVERERRFGHGDRRIPASEV